MSNGTLPPIQDAPAHPTPGFDTWAERHAAALVNAIDLKRKAELAPQDAALALASWDAMGDVTKIEQAMATEFMMVLRKTNEHSGKALRQVLTEVIGDVVDGLLNEFRNQLFEMAEAIVDLQEAAAKRGA